MDGPLPAPGTPVLSDKVEIGTMRSGQDQLGLAVLRLDKLDTALVCGGATLTPRMPAWLRQD